MVSAERISIEARRYCCPFLRILDTRSSYDQRSRLCIGRVLLKLFSSSSPPPPRKVITLLPHNVRRRSSRHLPLLRSCCRISNRESTWCHRARSRSIARNGIKEMIICSIDGTREMRRRRSTPSVTAHIGIRDLGFPAYASCTFASAPCLLLPRELLSKWKKKRYKVLCLTICCVVEKKCNGTAPLAVVEDKRPSVGV